MANLKEVRIRIASVNTTQQITKAMKLVAASKLKRAQDKIQQNSSKAKRHHPTATFQSLKVSRRASRHL